MSFLKKIKKHRALKLIIAASVMAISIGMATANTSTEDNNEINLNANDPVGLFSADNSEQGVKNHSPVDLSLSNDSLLGTIGDAKILLGFNDDNAAALELAAGPRVFRGNGTYGFALNDRNRIKLTGEYLAEDLDFDFFSGDTRDWIGQGAVGAAYQYWLGGQTFKNFQIGGHYSQANSKDLSSKTIDIGDGISFLDQRRIAGGKDWNSTAETGMALWAHSLLTVGADYDRVRYDMKYEDDDEHDAQGFGGHFRLQQLLAPSTQAELETAISQLADTYTMGLDWLWTSSHQTAWSVGLNSSYINDHTTERHFWVNGINFNVVWDTPHSNAVARYSDPAVSQEDLKTWTATPAVRMPDVLAVSDEKVTRHFQSATATCPDPDTVIYNASTLTYSAAGGWTQSYPGPGLSDFGHPPFDSANIMTPNGGIVECRYRVGIDALLLTNNSYQKVQTVSNNWNETVSPGWPLQTPYAVCKGTAGSCLFATVDPGWTSLA